MGGGRVDVARGAMWNKNYTGATIYDNIEEPADSRRNGRCGDSATAEMHVMHSDERKQKPAG